MFTGYREFDAYARSLRRAVWARQLERTAKSIGASTHDLNVGGPLGGEAVQLTPIGSERRSSEDAAAR